MTNNLDYTSETGEKILGLLDNWGLTSPESSSSSSEGEEDGSINPFIAECSDTPNKIITETELQSFWVLTVTKALMYCNRLNIDDLDTITSTFFRDGVVYWTASSLWQKYNIRVANDDLEDQFVQSYGGLLYKQGKEILDRFVVTHISNYHGKKDDDYGVWLI